MCICILEFNISVEEDFMDKRSGRTSSSDGKRSVNPKRQISRDRTGSGTRKINTISDETKKYKKCFN